MIGKWVIVAAAIGAWSCADGAMAQPKPINDADLLAECKALFDHQQYQGDYALWPERKLTARYEFRVLGLTNDRTGQRYCDIRYAAKPVGPGSSRVICGRTVEALFPSEGVAGYTHGRAGAYFPGDSLVFFSGLPPTRTLTLTMRVENPCGSGFLYQEVLLNKVE